MEILVQKTRKQTRSVYGHHALAELVEKHVDVGGGTTHIWQIVSVNCFVENLINLLSVVSNPGNYTTKTMSCTISILIPKENRNCLLGFKWLYK